MKLNLLLILFISLWQISSSGASDIICDTPGELMMSKVNETDFKKICEQLVKTDPGCQRLKMENRLNCEGGNSSNRIFSSEAILPKIGTCIKGLLWDSMKDMVSMFLDLLSDMIDARLKNFSDMYRFMTDEAFRSKTLAGLRQSTTKQSKMVVSFLEMSAAYFSREFKKNLAESPFSPMEAFGKTLFVPIVNLLTQAFEGVAQHYIPEYECLNGEAKVNTICKTIGGLVLPPTAIFAFLRGGKAALVALDKSNAGKKAVEDARSTFERMNHAPPGPKEKIPEPIKAIGAVEAIRRVSEAVTTDKMLLGQVQSGLAPGAIISKEKILEAASQLDDTGRKEIASGLKGRALSSAEANAVVDAHYIGLAEGRGFHTYTRGDISQKAKIMKDAGFSPAETRILMENGVVGGFSREATSELTESAVREAVSTKSKGAALGNKITTAFNRGQDISEDLKAFNLTQKQAGEAYFLAAIDEKNPILLKGSLDSFQKAGDGKSAFQVYQRGISDLNMSPEAILKGVSSDIAKLEAKIANSPNDPLFKQELKGLKEALLLLKDKHRPINSSPVQTARVAPPVKENPPIKATPPVKPSSPIKSASEVAPREARDIGSRLRLENRPEEASQYLLRASDGKRTFQDRYFFDAIEQSLKGEGTVAREVIREIHAKERNGLNDFIAEMHELGIHRDWAKTSKQKENIRRIMEEIKNIPSRERGLYTPQENMLQDMLRWTQE